METLLHPRTIHEHVAERGDCSGLSLPSTPRARASHGSKLLSAFLSNLAGVLTLPHQYFKHGAISSSEISSQTGGEGGIRTPGPRRVNGFQDRRFRPLSHLSHEKTRIPASPKMRLGSNVAPTSKGPLSRGRPPCNPFVGPFVPFIQLAPPGAFAIPRAYGKRIE